MPAAAPGALVADMPAGVVDDVKGYGCQHGEALAYLFDGIQGVQGVMSVVWGKDRGAREGFPALFRLVGWHVADMFIQYQPLADHEDEHQAHAAKQFEIDPGIGRVVIGDIEIKHAHEGEKRDPA